MNSRLPLSLSSDQTDEEQDEGPDVDRAGP